MISPRQRRSEIFRFASGAWRQDVPTRKPLTLTPSEVNLTRLKTVLILRHAKSSWSDPALDDHERPLNKRGRRDAPRMGELARQRTD